MGTFSTGRFAGGADEAKAYIRKIQGYPLLDEEEEFMLAKKWVDTQDPKAAQKLITSHLRLVAKIASGYRGYGLPMSDLIAEGNIGIMQAMQKFDPSKGYRFSTYAMWWVRAAMQDYVLRSWSLVKVGTTAAQKKLFFNLRRLKKDIAMMKGEKTGDEVRQKISQELGVKESEVALMEQRMTGSDHSLNATVSKNDDHLEWQDWLACGTPNQEDEVIKKDQSGKKGALLEESLQILTPRELKIIQARRLKENPTTLEVLAQEFGVSKERVRQLENRAFSKMQKYMKLHAEKYGW